MLYRIYAINIFIDSCFCIIVMSKFSIKIAQAMDKVNMRFNDFLTNNAARKLVMMNILPEY